MKGVVSEFILKFERKKCQLRQRLARRILEGPLRKIGDEDLPYLSLLNFAYTVVKLTSESIMKYPHLVSMPSPISDWLEEQLEARGIDSEVYTRYILSLLHAHTLDVICPEEDNVSFLGFKKDGGRASHKRLRRAGTWWKYAQADAEQIKRSAAVECLMSATEQSCEIESLVDELCEKLKEVDSNGKHFRNKANQDTKIVKNSPKERKFSPKELAEQYYAAFPPLNHREDTSYFPPKWPSSDKNHIDLFVAKLATAGSPTKTKRKPKRQFHVPSMKPTSRAAQGRNRFGYKRTHSGKSLTRGMADTIVNWDFVHYNNNYQILDQSLDSLDPTMAATSSDDVDMYAIDENDSPVCRMKLWLKNAESDDITINTNSTTKRTCPYEKKAQYIPLYPTTIWSNNKGPPNDDWSNNLEIQPERPSHCCSPEKGTYSSWITEEETAVREEYQRWIKEKEVECAIKKEYDRPDELFCHDHGTHIDSYFDINCNEATVDFELPSNVNVLSPGPMESNVLNLELQRQDDDLIREEYTNDVMCRSCDYTDHWWNKNDPKILDFNSIFDAKTISLMKINHSLDNSAFREYRRPLLINIDGLRSSAFSHQSGRHMKGQHTFTDNLSLLNWPSAPPPPISEEPNRSSAHMYFAPIKTLPPRAESKQNNIVMKDGTTFNIKSSPDEVKFERTGTGSLHLETEFGELRKYFEYNWRSPSDESVKLPRVRKLPDDKEFKIKYRVSSNDKSCQTALPLKSIDEDMVEISTSAYVAPHPTNSVKGTDGGEKEMLEEEVACKWTFSKIDAGEAAVKQGTPEIQDSLSEADEVFWGYALKGSDVFCKHCNVKHSWPTSSLKPLDDIDWDERTLKDIWGGSEECGACPWSTKAPTLLAENTTKLREESKEEAERLLSDLSSLQLSYSAKLLEVEAPFKINEGPCEKRRRHSYISGDTDLWSFTTRLQEDCLISLSTLPNRSSVTL